MKNLFFLKTVSAALILIFASCTTNTNKKAKEKKDVATIEIEINKQLVSFETDDEVLVTADLYMDENNLEAPFIVLFHQAGFSRGEYNKTADKFVELGFNCLAVDQRSGDRVNGVINQTHKLAVEQKLPTNYIDAMPDIEAAVNYVSDNLDAEQLFVLGSSYSASLALVFAAQNPDMLDGVLAFSPGEYFEYDERVISDYASELMTPVFVTSAKNEYENWKGIYNAIPDGDKVKYIPEVESIHGSRALWETTEGYEACWEAVVRFLKSNE